MIVQWFYGLLLALYPAEFRREYGAEMQRQFRDDWNDARQRGVRRAAMFWPHAIADWALAVFQLHGEIVAQDLRSALANLGKRPVSTTAMVILLSLAIAGTTSLCVFAAGLIFRKLPFESAGRLVFLAQPRAAGGIEWQMLPRDLAEKFRQTSRTLDGIALQTDFTETLDDFHAHGWFVTPAALAHLGIKPTLGRLLRADDDDAAVIGPRLWESRYRSQRSAIGSVIQLFGRDYRVVGVLEEAPAFPFDADIWASRSAQNGSAGVFGRIKPGKTLRDVQYEWTAFRQLAGGRWPAEAAWLRNVGHDSLLDFILWCSLGAFAMVLLLACADLACLQAGYALHRRREVAIRMAVGAPRGRVVRFLMTESLVVAAIAGALSVPVTAFIVSQIHARLDSWGMSRLAGWTAVRFDGVALLATAIIALAAGVAAGFLPAWRMAHQLPWTILMDQRPGKAPPLGRLRLALLGAQTTVAILTIALALGFSVESKRRLDSPVIKVLGRSWRASLRLPGDRSMSLVERIVNRLESSGQPAIAIGAPPFLDEPASMEYERRGGPSIQYQFVNARFFGIAGFRWRAGRAWTEEEGKLTHPMVGVVNQALAGKFPVGGILRLINANGNPAPVRIVGIVEQPPLDQHRPKPGPLVFLPYQRATIGSMNVIAPFQGDAVRAKRSLEAAILGSDPPLRGYSIQDYGVRIADNWSGWLAMVTMLWIAGAFALALAATGMAAYLTQTFVERRQPIALRYALGALVRNVWGWVNRQTRVAILTAALAALALWGVVLALPAGMVPEFGVAAIAAAASSVAVVAGMWCAVSWFASRRAACHPLAERLRY
jgi:putative ABC transport system permease protein